jgi:aryl-alcohol dehydrogenase
MFKCDAAVVAAVGESFMIESVNVDDPRAHEVVVRLEAVGLCHTDLSVREGLTPFPLPGVLGHEGAGIVEAVGRGVERVIPGDHVLLSFTSCGSCAACITNEPFRCDSWGQMNLLGGRRQDGSIRITSASSVLSGGFFGQSSFSEYANVDERCVIKIDKDAPMQVLAPLGCGIQTGFGTVTNVLQPSKGASLGIFGAGAVGLAAVMASALAEIDLVLVIDRVPERLRLAEELGASNIINATTEDVADVVNSITSGRGLDYTIEATGNPGVLEESIGLLAPGGSCAIVGAPRMGTKISVDVKHMMRSRRLVGVTEGGCDPVSCVPELVRLHQRGGLPIEKIITEYPFRDIERAAEDASQGSVIKPVLVFDR